MNKVIVDPELNIKEKPFFNKEFSKNRSQFEISKDLLKFVNEIENRGDRQIIYYVIYKIIKENKLDIDIYPLPKSSTYLKDSFRFIKKWFNFNL